jgi:hypothetical protein
VIRPAAGSLAFSFPSFAVCSEARYLRARRRVFEVLGCGNGVIAVEAVAHELAHVSLWHTVAKPGGREPAMRELAEVQCAGLGRDELDRGRQYPWDECVEVVGAIAFHAVAKRSAMRSSDSADSHMSSAA